MIYLEKFTIRFNYIKKKNMKRNLVIFALLFVCMAIGAQTVFKNEEVEVSLLKDLGLYYHVSDRGRRQGRAD